MNSQPHPVAETTCGEYKELLHEIRSAGLLRRRYDYYALKIAGNLLVFAGVWVAFAFLGDSWWQLLLAVGLAVVFAQLAFIGHDAGHKQIFRTRRPNMPRPHLRHAQPIVQRFCATNGIPYSQTSFLQSYRYVLRHLRETGAPLRAH